MLSFIPYIISFKIPVFSAGLKNTFTNPDFDFSSAQDPGWMQDLSSISFQLCSEKKADCHPHFIDEKALYHLLEVSQLSEE